MYRGFRSSFLSSLRLFVSSPLRSFVQTVWFSGSVVFGRIVFRSLRFLRTKRLSFASNTLATRCVSADSGRRSGTNWRSDRFIKAWAMPIIAMRERGVSAVHYRISGVGQDTANSYSAISQRILNRFGWNFYQNSQGNAGYTKNYITKDELIALCTELRYNERADLYILPYHISASSPKRRRRIMMDLVTLNDLWALYSFTRFGVFFSTSLLLCLSIPAAFWAKYKYVFSEFVFFFRSNTYTTLS